MESNGLDKKAVRAEGQGLGGLRDVSAAGESDAPPVKRKRGRPRKSERTGGDVLVEQGQPEAAAAEGTGTEQQLRPVGEADSERLQLVYEAGRQAVLNSLPQTREAMACAIDALIVDDPREFNAWMTQGVVLLKQQAQAAKEARKPRGVMVEDGVEDMPSSGIPADSAPASDDAHAAWFARRHGNAVPQYEAPPQAQADPNLAMLVRAAVQEYIQASGTQLAQPPPPAAGYGYPPQYQQPVFPPPLPPARPVAPNFWYDPRRR